jgi:quercetin dioxygenase-like cupin family protein
MCWKPLARSLAQVGHDAKGFRPYEPLVRVDVRVAVRVAFVSTSRRRNPCNRSLHTRITENNMVGHIAEAPRTHIRSEIVTAGDGYRIIRVNIPAGESLPCHLAPDIAIVVIAGEGRITVNDKVIPAEPGLIVPLQQGDEHAVYADQDLEIVLHQR